MVTTPDIYKESDERLMKKWLPSFLHPLTEDQGSARKDNVTLGCWATPCSEWWVWWGLLCWLSEKVMATSRSLQRGLMATSPCVACDMVWQQPHLPLGTPEAEESDGAAAGGKRRMKCVQSATWGPMSCGSSSWRDTMKSTLLPSVLTLEQLKCPPTSVGEQGMTETAVQVCTAKWLSVPHLHQAKTSFLVQLNCVWPALRAQIVHGRADGTKALAFLKHKDSGGFPHGRTAPQRQRDLNIFCYYIVSWGEYPQLLQTEFVPGGETAWLSLFILATKSNHLFSPPSGPNCLVRLQVLQKPKKISRYLNVQHQLQEVSFLCGVLGTTTIRITNVIFVFIFSPLWSFPHSDCWWIQLA